jgi:hypothetical protein
MENTGREEPYVSGEIERQTVVEGELESCLMMLDSKRLFTSMEAEFTHHFCNSTLRHICYKIHGGPMKYEATNKGSENS